MFSPRSSKDRINYGNVLMPPVGFHLERAIGTTYSLDLETLTAISISLGLIEETDSELANNPISMLIALQSVSSKITLFCEAGQIKLPHKTNSLCVLLEKMVVPVKLPFNQVIDRYPAFHPKIWLIEYSNDNEKRYRFVIMSRNLKFDHSWDVACSLEGEATDDIQETSIPLQGFIGFLEKQLDKELTNYARQNEDITYFANIISHIRFMADSRFSAFQILPLGIGDNAYDMNSDKLFTDSFNGLVVVSPFLSGSVINGLNNDGKNLKNTRRTLITRRTELSKLSSNNAGNFSVYVMKDNIVDGEDSLSGEDELPAEDDTSKQDIHAKVFLRTKNKVTDLYLGSMNATFSALNSNVEIMLRLQTKDNVLDDSKFLNDIMCENINGNHNPFELVELSNTAESETQATQQDVVNGILKRACRLKMHATVVPIDGKYAINLFVEYDNPLEADIRIRPMQMTGDYSPIEKEMHFEPIDQSDLSEFYVISVSIDGYSVERVIMVPTEGIPEEQDADIIRNTIKRREEFIEYIAYILGDDYIQTFLENRKVDDDYNKWNDRELVPAVYEKMLKASVYHPERIREIKYVTSVIDDDKIIPKEFAEMYKVFCDTLGIE